MTGEAPSSAAGPAATVLAIESSCDETAVAVLRGRESLLSAVVASQIEAHRPFGGVVPELASRQHSAATPGLLAAALEKAGVDVADVDVFAATAGPGLASSLLVGNTTAKALALACGKPFLAINHLEGHLLSPFFGDSEGVQPNVALVVSGGHTMLVDVAGVGSYELMGRSRDDAAGEAFDKVAKMLGLPYPGGPLIDQLAVEGDPKAYDFPRSMMKKPGFEFSFSGLKTSVRYLTETFDQEKRDEWLPDVCASFQQAVVDVLVGKTLRAAKAAGRKLVTVSGGVGCNRCLREEMQRACDRAGLDLRIAEPALSTDNAAMIAYVAHEHHLLGRSSSLDSDVDPNLPLTNQANRA
ncbi:tRNA (adenosine(37)-N6)-threonylcarbamoyltransferase complex transferase subunit TsaD [Sulfuriroseicoccus oceanibius]|uniref:tRNA N6-adenosine threonylcarbamoyltransferase n=1 Tax=Sulfuriroseicoccus oceanibius TaxID=2707525 RepID=A0A6B3LD96_9BACT|nr:tRNA (adenosine(37)-N6)-threonylcarbamoyltransferase complex transferase subunit TsaD [Sulfuriroseicoccus oceanibius]QQL45097.1 tRNA (adenosine(37)-N6)-threonylcarbamoyltransferase complex transferase subunit TsaD [Sulfuriroseicoccus oceanibius]